MIHSEILGDLRDGCDVVDEELGVELGVEHHADVRGGHCLSVVLDVYYKADEVLGQDKISKHMLKE